MRERESYQTNRQERDIRQTVNREGERERSYRERIKQKEHTITVTAF